MEKRTRERRRPTPKRPEQPKVSEMRAVVELTADASDFTGTDIPEDVIANAKRRAKDFVDGILDDLAGFRRAADGGGDGGDVENGAMSGSGPERPAAIAMGSDAMTEPAGTETSPRMDGFPLSGKSVIDGNTVVGSVRSVEEPTLWTRAAEKAKGLCHMNFMVPAAVMLFAVMLVAMANYVVGQRARAVALLRDGPAEAYRLEEAGRPDEARRLWIQINAQDGWYMPLAGLFTDIDEPYLQKASLAFKAEAWDDVVENAYRALNVPITDRQAVYVQQMVLTATAHKVRAYLPNQEEQPIRGGVPEHASPVCSPSSPLVWVVPGVLFLVSALCLYGRMKIIFAIAALFMPLYFWGVSEWNANAVSACEARLSFNPSRIQLYDIANRTAMAANGFAVVDGYPYGELSESAKTPAPVPKSQEIELPRAE